MIGADGVHSVVREAMLGAEAPRFTGRVAYRTVFPPRLLNGVEVYPCIKWWGPDRHIVSYFVNPRRDELYFVTSTPEPEYSVESWSSKGDLYDPSRRLRHVPSAGAGDPGGVPGCAQVGLGGTRPFAALGRGQCRAARRRLPSDDALHGAGRLRRRSRTVRCCRAASTVLTATACIGRCCATRRRGSRGRRASRLTSAQNTWLKNTARRGLGLRLRRLDRAVGGGA